MTNDTFLIMFLVFIALMTLFPMLMRRLSIPNVISLLIVGMIIGPNGLNLVHVIAKTLEFLGGNTIEIEDNFNSLVSSMGALGLVFLMALAGMEADFKLIRSARKPTIYLSVLTFLLPALAGYFVYRFFREDDLPGKLLYASLFASHSVGIVFPVIRELQLSRTRFGAAVLISTVITDIASIILLAVSVQLRRQELGGITAMHRTLSIFEVLDPSQFGNYFTAIFLLIVVLYLLFMVWIVYIIGKKIIPMMTKNEDALITFLLLVIMVSVIVGEILGINMVVGAFIAGLALSKPIRNQNKDGGAIFYKFEGIGYGLLIPFLFISIGMQTNFRAFTSIQNLSIILLTVVGLVGSKIFSGWLSLRLSGFSNAAGVCAGLMTVPQLSATLAAAAIGKTLGMLDDNFFNAIIILSIITTLPVPNLVRMIISKFNLKFKNIGATESDAFNINDKIEDDLI